MVTQSIGLPEQLLAKAKEAAAHEEISPEEFVRGAVETRLTRGLWRDTLAFGDANSRRRGLRPEDVEAEITAARAEQTR